MYAIVDMVLSGSRMRFVHCPPQPKSDLTASAASNGELGYAEALRRELGIRQHDQERSRASGRANSIVRQESRYCSSTDRRLAHPCIRSPALRLERVRRGVLGMMESTPGSRPRLAR